MKSFKEELDETFNWFRRKIEVLQCKEQTNEKHVENTFNEISQQFKLEASQDDDLEIKSLSNFQSLQEKLGKEHESDRINMLDTKLNDTTSYV